MVMLFSACRYFSPFKRYLQLILHLSNNKVAACIAVASHNKSHSIFQPFTVEVRTLLLVSSFSL